MLMLLMTDDVDEEVVVDVVVDVLVDLVGVGICQGGRGMGRAVVGGGGEVGARERGHCGGRPTAPRAGGRGGGGGGGGAPTPITVGKSMVVTHASHGEGHRALA